MAKFSMLPKENAFMAQVWTVVSIFSVCKKVQTRKDLNLIYFHCYFQSDLWLGGPYSGFAGRDASRGLATFSVEPVSDDYDDLSDLKPNEMEQVQEWELQFSEKYDLVGKLLKPGEESRYWQKF